MLHCDHHASHRLRVELDEIFGAKNFRDEIIWNYQNKYTGNKKNGFVKQHDVIYKYSKSDKFTFNVLRVPSKHGGRTTSTTERKRVNGVSKKVMKRTSTGSLVQQIVGDEKNRGDVLEVNFLNSQAKERLGYPTQKPEELLKILIEANSNEGDRVLDCFAGGFTTAKVALDTKRKFVCGDVSPVAIRMGTRRLLDSHPDSTFSIKGLPGTIEWFQKVDGFVFEDMVRDLMGWAPNPGDRGIDAWDGQKNPVQIKNWSKSSIGRPHIQSFLGAMVHAKKDYGVFVAWKFSKNAKEAVAEIKKKQKLTIELKDARDIFKELLIPQERHDKIIKLFEDRLPKDWDSNKERDFTNGELLELVS